MGAAAATPALLTRMSTCPSRSATAAPTPRPPPVTTAPRPRSGAPSLMPRLRRERLHDGVFEDRAEHPDDLPAFLRRCLRGKTEVRLRPAGLRERHVTAAHRIDDRTGVGGQRRHPVMSH